MTLSVCHAPYAISEDRREQRILIMFGGELLCIIQCLVMYMFSVRLCICRFLLAKRPLWYGAMER